MPKPGRRSGKPVTEHAIAYEDDGLTRGLTVAEWEAEEKLPPYSVYPEAKQASCPADKGFFMYRNATPEERAAMNKGLFMKIRGPGDKPRKKRNYAQSQQPEALQPPDGGRDSEQGLVAGGYVPVLDGQRLGDG